jgi:hypothetical protein
MLYVKYYGGRGRGIPCPGISGMPDTTLQITEDVGSFGIGGTISGYRFGNSGMRFYPVVAYLSGSEVIFGRRNFPSLATVSVSPRTWGFDEGIATRPFFLTNTAFATATETTIMVENTKIECSDSDRDKWVPLSCGGVPIGLSAGIEAGFGIQLTGAPIDSYASYEFTVWSFHEPAELWEISAELVATTVVPPPEPTLRRGGTRRAP